MPRGVETALGWMRALSPTASGLALAMDRRAERLRAALDGVQAFLAPTRFACERAREFGVPAERIRLHALGVAELGRRAGEAPVARPRVGFVGSLLPHKGVHVLVEAFRGLRGAELALEIHGSPRAQPSYAEALRRAAAGDARIRFAGPFEEGRQAQVLERIDVLALPSIWWENSPLVVLEARAAGVPVVASRVGGVPELVEDAVSGRLVPPGDPGALRAALDEVVSGRALAGPLPPVPVRTVSDEARELEALYAGV
jgi:glycosyltransferase involved in cell wall biosynthesis